MPDEWFREFAFRKENRIPYGHVMVDHVHMLTTIPPKYGVSRAVDYIKGNSAIWISQNYFGKDKNFTGQHFLGHSKDVRTVGQDKKVIAEYILNQEKRDIDEDRKLGLKF